MVGVGAVNTEEWLEYARPKIVRYLRELFESRSVYSGLKRFRSFGISLTIAPADVMLIRQRLESSHIESIPHVFGDDHEMVSLDNLDHDPPVTNMAALPSILSNAIKTYLYLAQVEDKSAISKLFRDLNPIRVDYSDLKLIAGDFGGKWTIRGDVYFVTSDYVFPKKAASDSGSQQRQPVAQQNRPSPSTDVPVTAEEWVALRKQLDVLFRQRQAAHISDMNRLESEYTRIEKLLHIKAAGWLEYARPIIVEVSHHFMKTILIRRRERKADLLQASAFAVEIKNEPIYEYWMTKLGYDLTPHFKADSYYHLNWLDKKEILTEIDDRAGWNNHLAWSGINLAGLDKLFENYMTIASIKNQSAIKSLQRDLSPLEFKTTSIYYSEYLEGGAYNLYGYIGLVLPE